MATPEVSVSGKRYTNEFKVAEVKQVTERGHRVAEVADRLGITTHGLYAWIRRRSETDGAVHGSSDDAAELRRVKADWRLGLTQALEKT